MDDLKKVDRFVISQRLLFYIPSIITTYKLHNIKMRQLMIFLNFYIYVLPHVCIDMHVDHTSLEVIEEVQV